MKEIEIAVEVLDNEDFALNALKFYPFVGEKLVIDTHYYDPLRPNLKPNAENQLTECLRLRIKNEQAFITYKEDKFNENGTWLYSDEFETQIESPRIASQILEKMGLKELVTIKSLTRIYKFENYEIVLEKVEILGLYLEVEFCTDKDVNVLEAKNEIQDFIDNLKLKLSPVNMGKPEMMLRKKKAYPCCLQ
jgi:predicted adenylyl cyclase CyaB